MKKFFLLSLFLGTAIVAISQQSEISYKYLYAGTNKNFVQKNRTTFIFKPLLQTYDSFEEFDIIYNGETTRYRIEEKGKECGYHLTFQAASKIIIIGNTGAWNQLWTSFMITKEALFYYIQGIDGNLYTYVATDIPISKWRNYVLLERLL